MQTVYTESHCCTSFLYVPSCFHLHVYQKQGGVFSVGKYGRYAVCTAGELLRTDLQEEYTEFVGGQYPVRPFMDIELLWSPTNRERCGFHGDTGQFMAAIAQSFHYYLVMVVQQSHGAASALRASKELKCLILVAMTKESFFNQTDGEKFSIHVIATSGNGTAAKGRALLCANGAACGTLVRGYVEWLLSGYCPEVLHLDASGERLPGMMHTVPRWVTCLGTQLVQHELDMAVQPLYRAGVGRPECDTLVVDFAVYGKNRMFRVPWAYKLVDNNKCRPLWPWWPLVGRETVVEDGDTSGLVTASGCGSVWSVACDVCLHKGRQCESPAERELRGSSRRPARCECNGRGLKQETFLLGLVQPTGIRGGWVVLGGMHLDTSLQQQHLRNMFPLPFERPYRNQSFGDHLVTDEKSCFPLLDTFIVDHFALACSPGQGMVQRGRGFNIPSQSSRCWRTKGVPRGYRRPLVRKVVHIQTKNIVKYYLEGYRYCPNMERSHRSNNVCICVDVQRRLGWIRCLDAQCAGFEGGWFIVPAVCSAKKEDMSTIAEHDTSCIVY